MASGREGSFFGSAFFGSGFFAGGWAGTAFIVCVGRSSVDGAGAFGGAGWSSRTAGITEVVSGDAWVVRAYSALLSGRRAVTEGVVPFALAFLAGMPFC